MDGPSATIALVLAETAAGGTAILWLGGLWGSVKRGFFILTGASVLIFALLATMAATSTVDPASHPSIEAIVLVALSMFSGLLGLSLAALILRADAVARVLGWLAMAAGVLVLVVFALITEDVWRLILLLSGAAFLGAVLTVCCWGTGT